MVLSEYLTSLLDGSTWGPGVVIPGGVPAQMMYRFLRTAILDRHIYLTKIVGFKFTTSTPTSGNSNTSIARESQIGDSYVEMVANLYDKLFLTAANHNITVELQKGSNDVPTSQFLTSEGVQQRVLYTNPYLVRCLSGDVTLHLQLSYSSGFKSSHKNSRPLMEGYFPCYTDFSLQDFVRVLPRDRYDADPGIHLRYYNGMTQEIFLTILRSYQMFIETNVVRREDQEWVSVLEQSTITTQRVITGR